MKLTVTLAAVLALVGLLLCAGCTNKKELAKQAYQRAQQYQKQGQLASARKELDTAVRMAPDNPYYLYSHANMLQLDRNFYQALVEYNRALELCKGRKNFEHFAIYCGIGRGYAYIGKGEYAKGVAEYRAIVDTHPGAEDRSTLVNTLVYNELAWALATCPDASVRDGHLAVQYALLGYGETPTPKVNIIDTLAAAYAEAGNYSEAVRRQQEAISKLSVSDKRDEFESRLRLYQSGQPYHQSR